MIIAIDGPAGSGKSTIAKRVAKELGINYLDTGAMYRVVTYYCLSNNLNLNDEVQVCASLEDIKIEIKSEEFYLNGVNVNGAIRDPKVTANVSLIASYKKVREFLVAMQQEIGMTSSCILDGRDIGSVVFPHADFKFYLTATAETRARRRFLENENTEFAQSYEVLLQAIIDRDLIDTTRSESPLVKVSDALEIDSSLMSVDDVVKIIIKKVSRYI